MCNIYSAALLSLSAALVSVFHCRCRCQAAKEAARDRSMVGDGVERIFKSRYDSISTYLHYCKRREENPMHVLEVTTLTLRSHFVTGLRSRLLS